MFINCHYVTLVTKFDVMLPKISEVKGIHPGAILKRELKKRGLKNKELAASINEHAQTLSAILNEKRGIKTGHPATGRRDLRHHRALGEQDMGAVQGRGQACAAQQEARRAGRHEAQEGPGPQGAGTCQGKTSRAVEAPLRALDKGGRSAADIAEVRRRALALAGRALPEKMGLHSPKADKEGVRAEAGKRKEMAGGGISGDRKKGEGGKGDNILWGRDGLQERPPGGQELCPQGKDSKLSIKLGLEFEVDYFMILQANYEVKSLISPDRNIETTKFYKLRKSLFWDTDFDNIDWSDNKTAVIKRIFERGNEAEIEEIIDYYGSGVVKEELKHLNNEFLPSFNYNVKKFAPKN